MCFYGGLMQLRDTSLIFKVSCCGWVDICCLVVICIFKLDLWHRQILLSVKQPTQSSEHSVKKRSGFWLVWRQGNLTLLTHMMKHYNFLSENWNYASKKMLYYSFTTEFESLRACSECKAGFLPLCREVVHQCFLPQICWRLTGVKGWRPWLKEGNINVQIIELPEYWWDIKYENKLQSTNSTESGNSRNLQVQVLSMIHSDTVDLDSVPAIPLSITLWVTTAQAESAPAPGYPEGWAAHAQAFSVMPKPWQTSHPKTTCTCTHVKQFVDFGCWWAAWN